MALTPVEALKTIGDMARVRDDEIHDLLYPKKTKWKKLLSGLGFSDSKTIKVDRSWLSSFQNELMGIGNGCSSSIAAISDREILDSLADFKAEGDDGPGMEVELGLGLNDDTLEKFRGWLDRAFCAECGGLEFIVRRDAPPDYRLPYCVNGHGVMNLKSEHRL